MLAQLERVTIDLLNYWDCSRYIKILICTCTFVHLKIQES